jgi:hypothetical protein
MNDQKKLLLELYETISMRRRPEDVAAMVLPVLRARLSLTQRLTVAAAARSGKTGLQATTMMEDFARPTGMQTQIAWASHDFLFPQIASPNAKQGDDVTTMQSFARDCGMVIFKSFGYNDFAKGRLTAQQRREQGLDISRRKYNRLFRFVVRLEEKVEQLDRNWKKYEYVRLGKTKLLTRLSFDEFASDLPTACFLAYFAARCNLRTRFTIEGQTKPFDKICESLFEICLQSKTTNWWAIAHLWPEDRVLEQLNDEQKGRLLGMFFHELQNVSELLRDTWERSNINRETMVVRRGNDSSTWNAAAVAWNRSRDGWISLLHSMNADAVLDAICPGKVLVLVAGDLAWMHSAYGKGLHPDTKVWNELPLPWQVLSGEVKCSRTEVENVCLRHEVDAEKSGWTAPRPQAKAVAFTPTPELVHGVEIGDPHLAKLLREAGVFSGKKLKGPLFTDS